MVKRTLYSACNRSYHLSIQTNYNNEYVLLPIKLGRRKRAISEEKKVSLLIIVSILGHSASFDGPVPYI